MAVNGQLAAQQQIPGTTTPEQKNWKGRELPKNINTSWFNAAAHKIENIDYSFLLSTMPHNYSSYNKNNGFSFNVSASGYDIKTNYSNNKFKNWQTTFKIKNITRGLINWNSSDFISSKITTEGLSFNYTNFRVDYLNTAAGMRQNFIIKDKQSGNGDLMVNIKLDNSFLYQLKDDKKLLCQFKLSEKASLLYDDLKVWDANGTVLPAYMQLNNSILSLIVNDKQAIYPITIDPLNHAPEWVSSAEVISSDIFNTTQLQTDAIYGYNVTGLGDVNGDGFDDVAIGAPSAIAVNGNTTIIGAGAVFIYFGSADGLATVPDKILRATTPTTAGHFGFSVAGGNVVGNNSNDIIIGSPGEAYTTVTAGTPATATVTAGKVYVFNGADITVNNPVPALSLFLNGAAYFSNGVIGIQPSNIAINALFGFSVAATEDMDADGLGEIIIGSPGYADVNLGLNAVRTGAAFVFYSGNLTNNLAVKLAAPTAINTGVPLNSLNGLLFGFSVDGLGDYNKDGKPDIIVGAPGGAAIDEINFLAGTAYIYNGNGVGVNTIYGTKLMANSTLSGPGANLFGYSVKGVKNANDVRNGNVLVGAPSGTILSSVTNGLNLKSGGVHVFLRKAAAPLQFSDQQILSSRNTTLPNLLSGTSLNITSLFGASIDNMLDVNCDGINDIIIGEPLSAPVGNIGSSPVGGTVAIYTGNADGTYNTIPYWTLANDVAFNDGVNAGSLLGFSVAGAKHVRGLLLGVRVLIGDPGAVVNFGAGVLNVGNTIGSLLNFPAANNGLGKVSMFGFTNCGVKYIADVNFTFINVAVTGNVSTNDVVVSGTTYGTPVPSPGNTAGASITLQPDGTYSFTSTAAGTYSYKVPVCQPGQTSCTMVDLIITVLTAGSADNPLITNTDYAGTIVGQAVVIKTLDNDNCFNAGCSISGANVTVTQNPANGTATVNAATGDITYTPNAGFWGIDTLLYTACNNSSPAKCGTSMQIIKVNSLMVPNEVIATDHYYTLFNNASLSGNVSNNDIDPKHNTLSIAPQTSTKNGAGTLTLHPDGSFNFVPVAGFVGPVNFPYTTCDNGVPVVCSSATLYLLVKSIGGTLAVSLIDFTAFKQGCNIVLKWVTAQEDDLREFKIQNSYNSIDWETVGIVPAKGNSSLNNNYSFLHAAPASGKNYYRLQLVTPQAKPTYSKTLIENINCSAENMVVSPNPFSDKIMVRLVSGKRETVCLNLFSFEGRRIVTKIILAQAGLNNILISDLGALPAGIYNLNLKTSLTTFNQKIVR